MYFVYQNSKAVSASRTNQRRLLVIKDKDQLSDVPLIEFKLLKNLIMKSSICTMLIIHSFIYLLIRTRQQRKKYKKNQ